MDTSVRVYVAMRNSERIPGNQQTGSMGVDPYEHVDPFTYRPRMSAFDWIKVCDVGGADCMSYNASLPWTARARTTCVCMVAVGDLQHSMASASEAISDHHS